MSLLPPRLRAPPRPGRRWERTPIRGELFGPERLERHAESLAAAHEVRVEPGRDEELAERLHDNEEAMAAAYEHLAARAGAGGSIVPAAEWFIDNFHVIDEQLRATRRDLPRRFYQQLPKLASGPFQGLPQVFSIAWAVVSHTDSRVDLATLERFVEAYQRIRPLTIGELWALSIMLRIVLLENVRRIVDEIVLAAQERRQADEVADRLLGLDGRPSEPIASAMRAYAHAPLPVAFTVQLVRRLHDLEPAVTPVRRWLETRLAAQGTTPDTVVHDDHQRQAALSVSVGNVVTSMRLISHVDWVACVERMSLVDAVLRGSSDFAEMDEGTRNRYRRAIEILALGSRRSEMEVAERAVAATRAAAAAVPGAAEGDARARDPGYFLIGEGRAALEAELGFVEPRRHMRGRLARLGLPGYLAIAALLTALLVALPVITLAVLGIPAGLLAVLAVLALLPASEVALLALQRAAARRFDVRTLPGMELKHGIPSEFRTLVVIPSLLTDVASIAAQAQRLEIHHLANRDDELRFALLSDWRDAPAETVDGDDELLASAAAAIDELNRRHGPVGGQPRFLLLHRRRVWCETQRAWIGWERKRGKLHELNRLLRGRTDTSFVPVDGAPPRAPEGVRYVLTLDEDTRMPRDTARRLVGKMAHPLNRPRLDPERGRVVEGYGILQPRVTLALPEEGEGSAFQRVFSGALGIDPYVSAASDVYQDLFGEGSYTGKGIYDVDAFEAALADRVPEGAVLSHDLFEGTFARAGLAADVEVVEDFPTRFEVADSRQHRWARGDWQLLPWVLSAPARGRRPDARRQARDVGSIPALGRWKMGDNLRRTLLPPVAVLGLLVGWLALPPAAALSWTGFLLLPWLLPELVPLLTSALTPRRRASLRHHLRTLGSDVRLLLERFALAVTLLAHEAVSMLDAIARTFVRMVVTRRRLLEWTPAEQAARGPRSTPAGYYRAMAPSVVLALGIGALVAVGGAAAWPLALPFVLAWSAAPWIAYRVSLPSRVTRPTPVSPHDARALRVIARRTWRFFEAFVTPEEHMLPPDNFQEDPAPLVAHRTSPTNVGLYLLSVTSARDFGWIGTVEMVERLEATLDTMARMERHRGHFSNWYDTRDLRVLEPHYVSSVDSGNLCGHLIAVARACRERIGVGADAAAARLGVADALAALQDALDRELPSGAPSPVRRGAGHRAAGDGAAGDGAAGDGAAGDGAAGDGATLQARTHLERLKAGAGALGRPAPAEDPVDAADALADLDARTRALLEHARASATLVGEEVVAWAEAAVATVASHLRDADADAGGLGTRLDAVAERAREFADEMDFGFLVSRDRTLLSIGYLVSEDALDPSCYDLLASEARLASFMAIAKDEVPVKHWFRLGRALTPIDYDAALASWSGSMFEYLMPLLVMREPEGSLLAHSNHLAVRRQIRYATDQGVPWGISESAYNARDLHLNYQYSSFGVPDLGFKRGLAEQLVIAPYATALAAMILPSDAVRNFRRLEELGALGAYGYYEALDYTPARLPEGRTFAMVRAYMAHHQGMTVVAIANAVQGGLVSGRFHAESEVRATELVLQERVPRGVAATRPRRVLAEPNDRARRRTQPQVRRLHTPHDAAPQTQLLSNGRYTVMVTAAGSGSSRWGDLAVTRWREDPTRDDSGSFVYLRDTDSGQVWSAAFQPVGVRPERFHVDFQEDRARFVRHDHGITTTTDVLVSAEADAEVRRVSLSNTGPRVREIEVTSYAELVLGDPAADAAHPAFSKMFVQTEVDPRTNALIATRRRRDPREGEVWAAHLCVLEGAAVGDTQFETDRARFLGRGRGPRSAVAVHEEQALTSTVGTVLDPVFALRRRLRLPPGSTARVAFWTMVAPSRDELLDLVDSHTDPSAYTRASTLAWTHAQVQLRHLRIDHAEAESFQRLASHVLYSGATLRPSSAVVAAADGGPEALWPHGISGDLPIVLLAVGGEGDLPLVRQLLRAHEYWATKGLAVDLVILNEQATSYFQELHERVTALARARAPGASTDGGRRGGIFVLRSDQTTPTTRATLLGTARAVLLGRKGPLTEQLYRLRRRKPQVTPAPEGEPAPRRTPELTVPALLFDNGMGGFTEDGREYVVRLGAGMQTPAPWVNVLANESFGSIVSADGAAHTWALNARERRITRWSNDPVSDPTGEALYLRDEESGAVWSPTAAPVRTGASSLCRHGFGYSVFEHAEHGIHSELLQLVARHDPVKVSRLRLRNVGGGRRRVSLTAYVEWVLGTAREATAHHLHTEMDEVTGAMLARNPWQRAFGERVAFLDLGGRQTSWTADRTEFLGRNGTLRQPLALEHGVELGGAVGSGLDPCGALRATVELGAGEEVELVVLLGETGSTAEARALLRRYREADVEDVMQDVRAGWDEVLGGIAIRTPDKALDLMVGGWLLYQTLASRIWARAGFYQASGAYGFRDQLQDGMALAWPRPKATREHLVRAAGRQFVEGDVQHWWLPHSGQGVRTRISDGRVWLAHALAHYLDVTGDLSVLDERAPFLEGPPLGPDEHESFFGPTVSGEDATVYEHAARALDRSLGTGRHGLPLMGTGDWNDGMNRVGEDGRGESVWLGWFLGATLESFLRVAAARGDDERVRRWRTHIDSLAASLGRDGWDGRWYRRAYFDDGTPLGTADAEECRIDAIAQSWSVISGMAPQERAAAAMARVHEHLVDRDHDLVLLFTPPFDRTPLDPGYIKGYPPGLRENGGQYTHAALWNVIAFCLLGDGDRAWELLRMINPVHRTATPGGMRRYAVEPYVVAADVYRAPGHEGRGGWTWYTGSSGWMHRAALEHLLGLRRRGDTLEIDPCIPTSWPGYQARYRHTGGTSYEVVVENPDGVSRGVGSATLDGAELEGRPVRVPLVEDGRVHRVEVVLGGSGAAS